MTLSITFAKDNSEASSIKLNPTATSNENRNGLQFIMYVVFVWDIISAESIVMLSEGIINILHYYNIEVTNYNCEKYMAEQKIQTQIYNKRMTPKQFLNPLCLHFNSKYRKMFIFLEVCSDAQLLTTIINYLSIEDLLNFTMLNVNVYELTLSIQSIELRIVKAKLKYYEQKSASNTYQWDDYVIGKWANQIDHHKIIVNKLNFEQKLVHRNNNLSSIVAQKYLKPSHSLNAPQKQKVSKLEELKSTNKQILHKNIGISYVINNSNAIIEGRIRSSTPEIIKYKDKMMKKYESDIEKSIEAMSQVERNKEKPKLSATKNNTTQDLSSANTSDINRQQQFNEYRGIIIPRVMEVPSSIVIKEETFFDRVRAKLTNQFQRR